MEMRYTEMMPLNISSKKVEATDEVTVFGRREWAGNGGREDVKKLISNFQRARQKKIALGCPISDCWGVGKHWDQK
jgi:hypothetical protein